MDPKNPVVGLCTRGMQAEGIGDLEGARLLYIQAWEASQDDFDACVAAHYLARHQESPDEALRWNQEALDRAEAVGDERVAGFYPSLYLNLGWSHESLGDLEKAKACYQLAANRLGNLPEGPYRNTVEDGIARGLKRVGIE